MVGLTHIDHLVLTVRDVDFTVAFYSRVLGMSPERFAPADGTLRWALKFGQYKINLHSAGAEYKPHAEQPMPGSADICLITEDSLDEWRTHLGEQNVEIEEGPITRRGARGVIQSIYLRDPDGNLVEISTYG